MIKPGAFIFDLDGTLVDSMGVWKQIDIDYLGKFHIELPEDLQKSIEGLSFTDTAIYMKERFRIPDSIEKMIDDWNHMAMDIYSHDVILKPGARQLLQYAKKHSIPCAIATSNSIPLVDKVLENNGVKDYFEVIITTAEVGKSKPAPDVYLYCAERMRVNAKDCVVFEDILAGIDGAHNAGMPACAIDDEYSRYQENEKKAAADFYVKDFTEFMENCLGLEEISFE